MSTITRFTKEQLIEWAKTHKKRAEEYLVAVPNDEYGLKDLALAEITLASLEAEPVAWRSLYYENHGLLTGSKNVLASWQKQGWECEPLYTAPPAPVSVPEWTNEQCLEFLSIAFRHAEIKGDLELDDIRLGVKMVNGSRAAMLQGSDEKPELTVWYGSMPETNGKANWTAILHRKGEGRCMDGFTIDRSEYPGRVLYAADRVRYLIGEKSERPSILDYDADAHSGYVKTGNSPVIPDGWVMVPVEPTYQMCEAMGLSWESPRFPDRYKAMISAVKQ